MPIRNIRFSLTLGLAWVMTGSRVLEADPSTIIASPTITQVAGAVTITYGDIVIKRTVRSDGPTLMQIRAAVQQVVEQNAMASVVELKVAIESQLELLDQVTARLGQLHRQMDLLKASSDDNYTALDDKLTAIAKLIESGRMGEAQQRLDDLYDLTKPGRSISLRALAGTNLGGHGVRILTLSFLRSYDLMVWPANVGANALSVGWGGSFGVGTAHGGYAAPSPGHEIIAPVAVSSNYVAIECGAILAVRRTSTLSLLAALEFELGLREYNADNDSELQFDEGVVLTRLSTAVAAPISQMVFATLSLSIGYEPWEKRPVNVYTGAGAAFTKPTSLGGIYGGVALSINIRK